MSAAAIAPGRLDFVRRFETAGQVCVFCSSTTGTLLGDTGAAPPCGKSVTGERYMVTPTPQP
jgi:hypothetical protein